MIKVNKKINLEQLDKELNGLGLNASLNVNREITEISLAENNTATQAELKAAIAAHIAIDEVAVKAQAKAVAEGKLAALGLTTDDLRALGL
jgi:hypothetical protein